MVILKYYIIAFRSLFTLYFICDIIPDYSKISCFPLPIQFFSLLAFFASSLLQLSLLISVRQIV